MYTLEEKKYLSLTYIMYVASASTNTPSYTHVRLYVYMKSPPPMLTSHVWTS